MEQMKGIVGLMGTKSKYLSDLSVNGIKRDNSAFFVMEGFDKSDSRFSPTLSVAIYHAISLEVQRVIKDKGIPDLSHYYAEKPEDMPSVVLVTINRIAQISEVVRNSCFYVLSHESGAETYPYEKVSKLGLIPPDNILRTIQFDSSEIQEAEVAIDTSIHSTRNGRFFYKKSPNKDLDLSLVRHNSILASEYMRDVCSNLANIFIDKKL